MRMRCLQLSLVLSIAAGLSGCTGGQSLQPYQVSTGGNAAHGKRVISQFGCGECHTIPGVRKANGVFGPPLNFMARRTIVGGNFPNDPDTLVHWIMSPQEMKPKTAMPDLGLTEQQARDAAAYLYTLQ